MNDIQQLIRKHRFFAGLQESDLELAAGCAANVHFPAGQHLFHEGESADHFYLLRSGRVALEMAVPGRQPVVIETLQAGDVIGWSWLFPPYLWQMDARALLAVRATAFDGKCLREKCASNHDLGYELAMRFAAILTHRLQATRLQLLDVYGSHH
ncbi:MAG: cyclic nucleotide-binding domain-containing protein [Verrucomicrobiales bacterium]|nr:cyclic nucleotide-binding domain-containing protein [Verrucomicrobiota bacterium JB025]